MISLIALPLDIIYEICEYLVDPDVLRLHVASPTLSQRLPVSRISRILSRKQFFIHRNDIPKITRLARLASEDPVRASRITHVTFDLSSPSICNLQCRNPYYGSQTPKKKSRFHRWCEQYLDSVHGKYGPIYVNTEDTASERGFTVVYNAAMDALKRIFKPPKFCAMSSEEEDAYNAAVISLFQKLPNLTTIRFCRDFRTHPKGRYEFERIVREYNPFLDEFFAKAPGLEDFPWASILAFTDLNISLHKAFAAILFCAVKAQSSKISSIYTPFCHPSGKDGIPISALEVPLISRNHDVQLHQAYLEDVRRYYTMDESGPTYTDLLGRYQEEYTSIHKEAWRSTFRSLKTLDFRTVENAGSTNPSAFFLAIVQNIEDLTIRLSPRLYNSYAINAMTTRQFGILKRRPAFVLPVDLNLPYLRKLKICHGGITVTALMEFLNTNKNTLKEVICTGSAAWNHAVTKPDILDTLSNIKKNMALERLEMDFLVNLEKELSCIFAVKIKAEGGWTNEHGPRDNINISFATWCDRDQLGDPGPISPVLKHWMNVSCWDRFVEEFEDLIVQDCARHWGGKVDEYISGFERVED